MRITKNINSKTFYRHTKKFYWITHGNCFIFPKNAIWRHFFINWITCTIQITNAVKSPVFRPKKKTRRLAGPPVIHRPYVLTLE